MAKPGMCRSVTLALALACGESQSTFEQTLIPERTHTVPIPLSAKGSIALLSDEATACVIDSYEVRVRCVTRTGEVVGVFGREGEGPGEFDALSHLSGGPDNSVGAVDMGLDRFSVFEPSGDLVTEVMFPGAAFSLNPDVYLPAEAEFIGSVRVHERVRGFDLLGSMLVVVVERQLPPDNPDGIAERAVDWYDVGEWR